MLKYCNGCKRVLEIDNFYSHKKSTCRDCINKKVNCDFCGEKFKSTNLSKNLKQRIVLTIVLGKTIVHPIDH